MSRRSATDRAFARAFGDQLRKAFQAHVKTATTKNRMSVQDFADSLNLTRAGLHKAMKGLSVPRMDLIEKARKYGVLVKYGDLDNYLADTKRGKRRVSESQPLLPSIIENLKKDNVRVELGDHEGSMVQLKVWIKFTG